jgi:hypothetical protein
MSDAKRKLDAPSADDPAAKRPRGVIPAHKGAFKVKHTRNHSALLRNSTPGVLVSCLHNMHAQTITEATTLLRQYIALLYPEIDQSADRSTANTTLPTSAIAGVEAKAASIGGDTGSSGSGSGSEAATNDATSGMAGKRNRVVSVIDTATEGLVYIAVDERVNVTTLVMRILSDMAGKTSMPSSAGASHTDPTLQLPKAPMKLRYCSRLMPVVATTAADPTSVSALAQRLLPELLRSATALLDRPADTEAPPTFAVIYRCTNNATMKNERTQTINCLAQHASAFKADLKKPDVTILGTVFKSVFALSCVTNYYEYCKFNAMELQRKAPPQPKRPHQPRAAHSEGATTTTNDAQVGDIDSTPTTTTADGASTIPSSTQSE